MTVQVESLSANSRLAISRPYSKMFDDTEDIVLCKGFSVDVHAH